MRIFPAHRPRRRPVPQLVWGAACIIVVGFFALPDFLQPRVEGARTSAGVAITPAGPELIGVASIIDGDTIEIHGKRIRLHAIDAPETRQRCIGQNGQTWRCGVEASRALDTLVGRATVSCTQTDTDRYGRIVAICNARGTDLGDCVFRRAKLTPVAG